MPSVAQIVRLQSMMLLFRVVFRPDVRPPLVRLGTEYGGWWVPTSLRKGAVCYLAGVGTDISFDLALVDRFECSAWALDPTPRSIEWISQQDLPPAYGFLAVGLAGEDGKMRFFAPADDSHVSHSIVNLQGTTQFFEADCTTVASLMRRLGHSHVDLLKMDIEGAQHAVIHSLIRDAIFPTVLCVEFDQPERLSVTRSAVKKLRQAGYALAKVEGFNMTFLRV